MPDKLYEVKIHKKTGENEIRLATSLDNLSRFESGISLTAGASTVLSVRLLKYADEETKNAGR